jgi:hypothetical protein
MFSFQAQQVERAHLDKALRVAMESSLTTHFGLVAVAAVALVQRELSGTHQRAQTAVTVATV